MSVSDEFFQWQRQYFSAWGIHSSEVESIAAIKTEFQVFLGTTLPPLLNKLAVEAERNSIDSTPIFEVLGQWQMLSLRQFESAMNSVWNIAQRIKSIEATKPESEPDANQLVNIKLRSMCVANKSLDKAIQQEYRAVVEDFWKGLSTTEKHAVEHRVRAAKRTDTSHIKEQIEIEKMIFDKLVVEVKGWFNNNRDPEAGKAKTAVKKTPAQRPAQALRKKKSSK